ncbi:MAG: hypothetical protein AB1405_03190 [Bdellovibrionota bacterium]
MNPFFDRSSHPKALRLRPEDYAVVTRFSGFYEYCIKSGICPRGAAFLPRPDRDLIAGKIVIGPVSPYVSVLARAVIHVPVESPDRNFSLEECEQFARPPLLYQARRIEDVETPELLPAAKLALRELLRLGGAEAIVRPFEAAVRGVREES